MISASRVHGRPTACRKRTKSTVASAHIHPPHNRAATAASRTHARRVNSSPAMVANAPASPKSPCLSPCDPSSNRARAGMISAAFFIASTPCPDTGLFAPAKP